MGHLVGKDLYRQLGMKIDGLTARAPWNDELRAILEELYSREDADLVVRMPYGASSLGRLARVTGLPRDELQKRLDSLCPRGLVMDLSVKGRTYYLPSPMVIGIFEFTMMRRGDNLDRRKLAAMFHAYLSEGSFYEENCPPGMKVPLMRALPHEDAVRPEDAVEVLDYEKASTIVRDADRFCIGTCSCRHEKHHLGEHCRAPLETCSTFGGTAVDYLVRNGLAREVSRTEMLENLARSREHGLVFNADNVKHGVGYICHCCGCCCNMLLGVNKHGYPHIIKTSNFIAFSDPAKCNGCGRCSRECPIDAIPRSPDPDPRFRKFGRPKVDESRCLGCGVCTRVCRPGALKLHSRPQRVFHPDTTFERVILQCLERGTLENQLFDNPASRSQAFLRGVVGGFLRLPPVKQALMSDLLRSRFLSALRRGARAQGGAAVVDHFGGKPTP